MAESTTTTHIATSSRLAVRAINDMIRTEIAPLNRLHKFWPELSGRGRVKYRCGGNQIQWEPTLSARSIRAISGNPSTTSFPSTTTEKVCLLPYRGYDLGEHITKLERLATQSSGGYFGSIVKIVKDLNRDFMLDLNKKWIKDGNATGTNDLHGMESIFAYTGLVSNSVFASPTDSYAGLTTNLGVTGSWTAESGNGWPTGSGDVEYCSFSPFICDVNNTAFNGTVANWFYQWEEALNRTLTFLMVLQQVTPDTCMMSPTKYAQAKDSLKGSTRFTTTADSNLVRLGHRTLSYDGVEIWTDAGVTQDAAYLIPWDKLELRVMGAQLIEMEEDKDISTGQWLYKLDSYLNLIFESPAYFGKILGVSAEGT